MKVRYGFVTNSSSTNFLIISREALTPEFLFEKLGFKEKSSLASCGRELCDDIMSAIEYSSRRYPGRITFEYVQEEFGEKSARIYEERVGRGFYAYVGKTSSDQGQLTVYFTTDFFEIEESDFYVNGMNYIW